MPGLSICRVIDFPTSYEISTLHLGKWLKDVIGKTVDSHRQVFASADTQLAGNYLLS